MSLPATATVLFAGLYWGGDTSGGSSPSDVGAPTPGARGCVGFQTPGASGYATLSGAVDQSSTSATRYGAFANVTSIVAAAGAGTYSVANVQTGKGGDRYAGWTLVVAYRDPTQPPRNLTVDDGFITINSSAPPTTIPIAGFRTPPTGSVNTTLGFVAYEGDAGLTGDSASLNGTKLSDSANPPSNFFNGGISNLGMNVTTRNPNDVNNWDYDSKLVNANGILPNNATTANIVVTTSGDTYYPGVVTLATDLYAPKITSSKTVVNLTHPGGPDQRGDVLRYTVSYTNSGSDAAANFVMRDSIPSGTTYVPGSLRITAGPQAPASPTDALGDDAGEFDAAAAEVVFRLGAGGNATTGGRIAPGETDTVTFNVTIDPSDAPGQQILNQATATFTGLTLGTPFIDTSPLVTDTVAAPSLVLTKSHTGSLIAGQPTTFSLAVSNVGNLGTDGSVVTVTDPFPASSFSSIANAGGSGWSCSIAGLTLTCSRSDVLAAGTSYPAIFVDATVQDPAPATISNTATVSGGGSASASASDGGGANGLADVSITKTADPTNVFSGDRVTYTLNVQNAGPSSAQGVTVSDPVDPASFGDVIAQTTQGTCDTTVSCSLGTLAAGGSATITITATVIARDTTLTNNATVASSTPDPLPANNSASATVTVLGTADLTIAKAGTVNPMQDGTDSFTLTVSNNGPDTAHGIVVNDTLPSQFTASAASGGGFSCALPAGPGGTVACTLATLAPTAGSPVQITITGTLSATSAGQTISDAATVSSNTADSDLSNNSASLDQLVGPVADLTISKAAFLSDGVTPVTNPLAVGGTFIYALDVTNNGPDDAAGVVVTDPLPAGMTLTTPIPSGCAASGGTVTCTIGTLPAGQTTVLDLAITVGAAAANTAPTNTASVSSTTVDPDTTNDSASATVGVGQVASLALAKSVSPQTANVGDQVTYTFVVTNNAPVGEAGGGPTGLGTTGALVTDPLPSGLRFVASSTGSSCTDNPGPPETVSCDLGAVVPGATATASFVAQVTSVAAGSTVPNTATVATESAGGSSALPNMDPANGSADAALIVNPEADLSLTKTVSNPNPAVDDEVDYTLTASNAGPNDATGVTITDSLPAGLAFLDATPGCDNQNGTVTCDIGTLAAGERAAVTIRALTTGAVAGTAVGNLATVSGNELDPDPGNNQAAATIDVQPLVDLRLTKVASNPAPAAGGPVTYTLTLVNRGPSPAAGVTITDPLPSGLSFISATAGQGSCRAQGQTVTCDLGAVAAGGTATVTLTADVATSVAGTTVQNTATASTDDPIARPELVSSEAIVNPTSPPPAPNAVPPPAPSGPPPPTDANLDLSETVDRTEASSGAELKYTFTITNDGAATAANPTFTDAFSAPVEIIAAHGSTGSCSARQPVTCTLEPIAPGGHVTITLIARAESVGELRNTARVATPTPLTPTSHTLATATTRITPGRRFPAGLTVSVGYADGVRGAPRFPSPWRGAPGVTFEGCRSRCHFDGGAVKLTNTSAASITINSLEVALSTCTYKIWPTNVLVRPGHSVIYAQTVSGTSNGCTRNGHFDTSDVGPRGARWSGHCSQSGVIPRVEVTANTVEETFSDSTQRLNTGGADLGLCPRGTNESHPWSLLALGQRLGTRRAPG